MLYVFNPWIFKEKKKAQKVNFFLNKQIHNLFANGSWECRSVVEHLPNMCEVLGLIPSTKRKPNQKQNKQKNSENLMVFILIWKI
jgi:hypothetical protein